jgi:hypothetical protein
MPIIDDTGQSPSITKGMRALRLFTDPPHLTLEHTRVISNTLSASPRLPVEGGGLFSAFAVTLGHSRIAYNHSDQCAGSGCKKGS